MKCELCKSIVNLIENDHPKAKYRVLCTTCIKNLPYNLNTDKIMFERIIKKSLPPEEQPPEQPLVKEMTRKR